MRLSRLFNICFSSLKHQTTQSLRELNVIKSLPEDTIMITNQLQVAEGTDLIIMVENIPDISLIQMRLDQKFAFATKIQKLNIINDHSVINQPDVIEIKNKYHLDLIDYRYKQNEYNFLHAYMTILIKQRILFVFEINKIDLQNNFKIHNLVEQKIDLSLRKVIFKIQQLSNPHWRALTPLFIQEDDQENYRIHFSMSRSRTECIETRKKHNHLIYNHTDKTLISVPVVNDMTQPSNTQQFQFAQEGDTLQFLDVIYGGDLPSDTKFQTIKQQIKLQAINL